MDLYKFEDLKTRESSSSEIQEKNRNVGMLPMIIAMTGEAYTDKTTCARAIANSYRCSVVSFDAILDSISSTATSPKEPDQLVDLAFEVILRVVRLQLCMRRPIVVDSLLSKPSHLDQLLRVADEFMYCDDVACEWLHCRFVIVECRPEAKYAWEQRFEKRDRAATDKWYKPKEWNDVLRGCTESLETGPSEGLPEYICKLIVDTTGCVPGNYGNLGPATLDLCACPKGHVLNFLDWLPESPLHTGFPVMALMKKYTGQGPIQELGNPDMEASARIVINCGDDGRHLLEELTTVDVGDNELGCCRACHGPISYPGSAYACSRCKLALHKSCAELLDKATVPDPRSNLPLFLRISSSADEFYSSIPDEYKVFKCSSCREFSVECEFCLWDMHLRSGVVPTIVHHEGHHGGDHSACFWITSALNPHVYQCEACKLPGSCAGYTCLKRTFQYNVHVECALLPRPLRHVHGGHEHDMHLVFGTKETEEDYLCDVCLEPRDPTAWITTVTCVFLLPIFVAFMTS